MKRIPGLFFPAEYDALVQTEYEHMVVYAARLVAQEIHTDDQHTSLKVLGTLLTLLCYIPVAKNMESAGTFRQLCQHAMKATMGDADQWCIAILKEGSTLTEGPCTLVKTVFAGDKSGWKESMKEPIATRSVETSLWDECVRMGVAVDKCRHVTPLVPCGSGEMSTDYAEVQDVVDSLLLVYKDGKLMGSNGYMCLGGQGVYVNRFLTQSNPDLLRMRNGFSKLWFRSFHTHSCICISGDCEGLDMVIKS